MADKKETEIIYRLVDEISKDAKSLQEVLQGVNNTAQNSTGFDTLTGKIITANLATQALMKGFQLLQQGVGVLGDVLQAGAKLDMMNTSLTRISSNMGYTTEEVKKFRDALEDANTYGSNQTEVLKTLMQNGLIPLVQGMQFANGEQGFGGFIHTIKDFAAAAQVTSGTALKDFSTAIQRLEPLLIDKYFTMRNLQLVYQDYADTLGKTAIELTEQEKRQAFLNEIVKAGAIQVGVYSDTYGTAGKNLLSMQDATQALAEEIGLQLQPAYKVATNTLLSWVQGARQYIKDNPNFVKNVVIVTGAIGGFIAGTLLATKLMPILTFNLGSAGAGFSALAAKITATSLATGLLGLAFVALGALVASSYMKQVEAQQKVDDQTKQTSGSLKDMFTGATGGSQELNKALAENQAKLEDIQQQIQRENEQYNKQLNDIKKKREQDLADAKASLEELNKAFTDKKTDRDKKYADQTDQITQENDQRLADLENTLGAELQVGSSTYDQDLLNYQMAIEAEKAAGQDRLDTAKTAYEEETAKAQEEYNKQSSALQTKITEDEDLLRKHADVLSQINQDMLNDEIDDLVLNHQRRLEELNKQLDKERNSFSSYTNDIGNNWDSLMGDMNDSSVDWKNILKPINLGELLNDVWLQIKGFYFQVVSTLWNGINDVAYFIAKGIADMFNNSPLLSKIVTFDTKGMEAMHNDMTSTAKDVATMLGASPEDIKSLYGNAMGTEYWKGGTTLVGERGAEIVDLPQGAKVTKNSDIGDRLGGGNNINIINNYPEGVPADLVVSRQMFQLKTLGV